MVGLNNNISSNNSGENEKSSNISKYNDSLNDLPDTVYIPLGSRGMESVPLKQCVECSTKDLILLKKTVAYDSPNDSISQKDISPDAKEINDYFVRCKNCDHHFIIRITNLYHENKLFQTFVFILSNPDSPELWLGYF